MSIREGIEAELKASGAEEVFKRIIKSRAEKVIVSRMGTADAIFTRIENIQAELDKIKPDQVVYDESGTEVSSGYSRQKLQDRDSKRKNLEKLEKALARCASENTQSAWDDLAKLAGGGGKDSE